MNLKKNTDFSKKSFDVIFTQECIEEMYKIYNYISTNLENVNAAKRLMSDVRRKILNLGENPRIYTRIDKSDYLKREYHRIVIKNYVILYTIDFKNQKIFISHMIYSKRNYID